MPTISYTATIKCVNQVRSTTDLPEGYVDNIPLFYRQTRETQLDFYNSFVGSHPELFSNGSTSDGNVIESGFLKTNELNGPCLLLDQEIGTNPWMGCKTYEMQLNNLNSYIFRRAIGITSIYAIYPITIQTYSSIQYFQSTLAAPVFTPNLKNSAQVFTTTILDAMSATGGIAAYKTSNTLTDQQFNDLCEYTPVSFDVNDPYPIIFDLRTNYFPVYKNAAILIETESGVTQYIIPVGALDNYNGIVKIDLTTYGTPSDITGFYIFYAALPSFYPLIREIPLYGYNATTMQPVIISNKTSSTFDQISLSTNEITLVKDPDNTATDQVTIVNNSNEYLFIETDQDIQINGKTFLAGTESILPGQYSVLNIKLARSIYNTIITTINIQIGIYDRYNGVKKYIDSIQVTVS